MKGYLSIREAAEKWGVSERRVSQYCAEGRIPGVQRFGTSWAIPDTANKPGDPRKNKTHEPPKTMELYTGFMPLMSTSFAPGKCMETIEKIPNGPRRKLRLRNTTISVVRLKKPCKKRAVPDLFRGGLSSFGLFDLCLCVPVYGANFPCQICLE